MGQSRLGSRLGCGVGWSGWCRQRWGGGWFKIRRFLWGFRGIRLHSSGLAAKSLHYYKGILRARLCVDDAEATF